MFNLCRVLDLIPSTIKNCSNVFSSKNAVMGEELSFNVLSKVVP